MTFYKIPPALPVLLAPVWLALLLMLALGCGLYASALMVSYRDVQHILPVITPFLLYASPVSYRVSAVPEHYRFYYCLNPLVGMIDAFRWSLLGGGAVEWGTVAYSAAFAVVALIGRAFAHSGRWNVNLRM